MKKTLLSMIIISTIFTLVSCSTVTKQNPTSNKVEINEYIDQGATLEGYTSNGTAIMKDTVGAKFFAGCSSTYKVKLNEDGIILPYIIINNNLYYFQSTTDNDLSKDFKKADKISLLGGDLAGFLKNTNANNITELTAYNNKTNLNVIYTKYKNVEGYQIWSK